MKNLEHKTHRRPSFTLLSVGLLSMAPQWLACMDIVTDDNGASAKTPGTPGSPRPPGSIEKRLEESERKNQELERKNQEFELRLGRVEKAGPGATGAAGSGKDLEAASPGEDDESSPDAPSTNLGMGVQYGQLNLSFEFFGDIGYRHDTLPESGRARSSFAFGTLDFFTIAKVGEKFQALSETVLEGDEGAIILDQERLSARWSFADWFYLQGGLDRLPTSRWNRLYHQGKWLQVSVDRPSLALFEDAGGILPMYYMGVEGGGHLEVPLGMLEYTAIVWNGRGADIEDRQTGGDANAAKAFDLALGFSPTCYRGLQFGSNFHYDDIPGEPGVPARSRSIRQIAVTPYVQLKIDKLDVIAEYVFIENKDRTSRRTFQHRSGYVQASYALVEKWTPYARFEFRSMMRGDPFFEEEDADLDLWEQIFGIRYDLTTDAAIKLELGFGRRQDRKSSGVVTGETHFTTAVQLAWGF